MAFTPPGLRAGGPVVRRHHRRPRHRHCPAVHPSTGEFSRTQDGTVNATLVSSETAGILDSGVYQQTFHIDGSGDLLTGKLNLTKIGGDHFSLLVFLDGSNTWSARTPGTVDYSPLGTPFGVSWSNVSVVFAQDYQPDYSSKLDVQAWERQQQENYERAQAEEKAAAKRAALREKLAQARAQDVTTNFSGNLEMTKELITYLAKRYKEELGGWEPGQWRYEVIEGGERRLIINGEDLARIGQLRMLMDGQGETTPAMQAFFEGTLDGKPRFWDVTADGGVVYGARTRFFLGMQLSGDRPEGWENEIPIYRSYRNMNAARVEGDIAESWKFVFKGTIEAAVVGLVVGAGVGGLANAYSCAVAKSAGAAFVFQHVAGGLIGAGNGVFQTYVRSGGNASGGDYAVAATQQGFFGLVSPQAATMSLFASLTGYVVGKELNGEEGGQAGMLVGSMVGNLAGGTMGGYQMAGWRGAGIAFGAQVAGGVGGLAYAEYNGLTGMDKLQAVATGMQVGEAGASIYQMLRSTCFAPETRLRTPSGCRAISDFRKGDAIFEGNEFDPQAPPRVGIVDEVFENYLPLLSLHVGGQVVRTTENHPFYVKDRGWTPTKELHTGDLLRSHDGQWVPVEEVIDNGEESKVYNLRVLPGHTYFVGGCDWGFSVWAHNACVVYDARTNNYRDTTTGQFVKASDLPWPSSGGFATSRTGILRRGTVIDRYGSPSGYVAGRPGDTVSQRGLPPGSEGRPYTQYEVVKTIRGAEIGTAAPVPAFDAAGGGRQYTFGGQSIQDLVDGLYLRKL